jgi:ribonuclease P protein component
MLPRAARLTSAKQFSQTFRRGARAGGSFVVVHIFPVDETAGCKAGFVVSKAVGNAVVRNRVKRRLRELIRPMMAQLPGNYWIVVRALPESARSRTDLQADLSRTWQRALAKTQQGVV